MSSEVAPSESKSVRQSIDRANIVRRSQTRDSVEKTSKLNGSASVASARVDNAAAMNISDNANLLSGDNPSLNALSNGKSRAGISGAHTVGSKVPSSQVRKI